MRQVIQDLNTGVLQITESWEITGTGSNAPYTFEQPDDEIIFSFININNVEKFKTSEIIYDGQTENRYLVGYYRISRDNCNWTQWLELNPVIDNFPPFSSRNTMYLEVKFVRMGTSTSGTLTLLSYTINGSLERNVADGTSVITLNNSLSSIIVKPPYVYKVFKLSDIETISSGGDFETDYSIKYRFSQDYGRTVSEWEYFNKENITTVRINPIRFFQIEYLVELTGTASGNINIYDINLIGDFQNVTLDYFKSNLYGVRQNCNCLKLGLVSDPSTFPSEVSGDEHPAIQEVSVLPQLSEEDKTSLFEPYKLQTATELLDKLSNDSNLIFGHDVVYFLTDPDVKGIDYTFHEYQLYNYVANCDIKVSVENNQFPENNGMINQFDLSLFDTFEIHIPKKVFKETFGPSKRPSKEDFLWFCEINKMFIVEHSHAYRGFNNNAIYYKVMLKKYNQKANVIGANQAITNKLENLTRNSTIDELFGLENNQDKDAVANKDQHRPLTQDPVRLDITANIVKELIENAELILSKSHYDLSSVTFTSTESNDAVTYKNIRTYFSKGDNLSYTCWFNINNYTINDNYHLFNYYDDTNSLGFDINITDNISTVKWNSDTYELDLDMELDEETWYCYLVNINQRQRKINQYIYKRDVDFEEEAGSLNSTKLRLVYSNELDLVPIEFKLEDVTAKLLSGDMRITNIRLFSDVIPEDQHNKILNQTIIRDDSKFLIFADNANTRLVLPNYPLGQIRKGEV